MTYLETGNIKNSVNLPDVAAPFASPDRFTLIHQNIPNMLGQISTFMADEGINIENLVNRSRGGYAYTMLDVSNLTPATAQKVINRLSQVDAITRVRLIHHN